MLNEEIIKKMATTKNPSVEDCDCDDEDDALKRQEKRVLKNSRRRVGRGKTANSHAKRTGDILHKTSTYDKMEKNATERLKLENASGHDVLVNYNDKQYSFSELMFEHVNGNSKESSQIIQILKNMKNKDKYSGSLYNYLLEKTKE